MTWHDATAIDNTPSSKPSLQHGVEKSSFQCMCSILLSLNNHCPQGVGKEFKWFLGWDTELHLPPTLTFLIEGTWILPGGSVSTYWRWYHLSALAVISCLIDFCLVTPPASSLSQAPLLCISLPLLYWLIDSSIHLLQGGWQAGIWLFCLPVILQPAGWLPEVPGVLPKWPVCKPLLPTAPKDATNSLWQNMELLINFCLCVLRCQRELIFDLVTMTKQLQTVFPGAPYESSLIVALTEPWFSPGIQAEPNSRRGVSWFPSTLYNIKTMLEELWQDSLVLVERKN